MLTKPCTMILGIIEQQPVNAYEILKLLKIMGIQALFPIGDSTVYATLKKLEHLSLIDGNMVKTSALPGKMIYHINEYGRNALRNTIREATERYHADTTLFTVASMFLDIFPKEEVLAMLDKREMMMISFRQGFQSRIDKERKRGIPAYQIANLYRQRQIISGEIQGLYEFRKCFEDNFEKKKYMELYLEATPRK